MSPNPELIESVEETMKKQEMAFEEELERISLDYIEKVDQCIKLCLSNARSLDSFGRIEYMKKAEQISKECGEEVDIKINTLKNKYTDNTNTQLKQIVSDYKTE